MVKSRWSLETGMEIDVGNIISVIEIQGGNLR